MAGAPSEATGGPAGGAATIGDSGGGEGTTVPRRWANATTGIRGSQSVRGGPGSMSVETGLMTLHEDELKGILQVLAQIARTSEGSQDKLDPASFQSRLSTLP